MNERDHTDILHGFVPCGSEEVDSLGIRHVRLQRYHHGLPVFGEQLISHQDSKRDNLLLGVTGNHDDLHPIEPSSLGTTPPQVTREQVIESAKKQFFHPSDPGHAETESAERGLLFFEDRYHQVWRVALIAQTEHSCSLGTDHKKQIFFFHADQADQEIIIPASEVQKNKKRKLDLSLLRPRLIKRTGHGGATYLNDHHLHDLTRVAQHTPLYLSTPMLSANRQVHLVKNAKPELVINDNRTISSTITFTRAEVADATITKMTLFLDIAHTFIGDLVVTLINPSSRQHVVTNRSGGSTDNIIRTFDLSAAFFKERVSGAWTLTVSDKASGDTGKLRQWSLDVVGDLPAPPPPPPPPVPPVPPAPTPSPVPPQTGINDVTVYEGVVDLGINSPDPKGVPNGTKQQLLDQTRGQGVETRDAKNTKNPIPANTVSLVDDNGIWGQSTDSPRQRGAVDAHYCTQMTYDFYRDILGRNSIDNRGEKLISNVHVETGLVNAFWFNGQMWFGDGDGVTSDVLTTLDITGHEITHGLTERTAGLNYEGASGGLNEGFSDIMGVGVRWHTHRVRNQPVSPDQLWKLAEQCWTPHVPGDALRYMNDPRLDGYSIDHFSLFKKNTEVHASSGIFNNFFYLLVSGGTNRTSQVRVPGLASVDGFDLAMEKGLKIVGRAVIYYMTPTTNFSQARAACVHAATDLYGATPGREVDLVSQAWSAVGVPS